MERRQTKVRRGGLEGIRTQIIETDLFAIRPLPIVVALAGIVSGRRAAVDDLVLVSLARSGCSLRQIAHRVGVSHETVRKRLRRAGVSVA